MSKAKQLANRFIKAVNYEQEERDYIQITEEMPTKQIDQQGFYSQFLPQDNKNQFKNNKQQQFTNDIDFDFSKEDNYSYSQTQENSFRVPTSLSNNVNPSRQKNHTERGYSPNQFDFRDTLVQQSQRQSTSSPLKNKLQFNSYFQYQQQNKKTVGPTIEAIKQLGNKNQKKKSGTKSTKSAASNKSFHSQLSISYYLIDYKYLIAEYVNSYNELKIFKQKFELFKKKYISEIYQIDQGPVKGLAGMIQKCKDYQKQYQSLINKGIPEPYPMRIKSNLRNLKRFLSELGWMTIIQQHYKYFKEDFFKIQTQCRIQGKTQEVKQILAQKRKEASHQLQIMVMEFKDGLQIFHHFIKLIDNIEKWLNCIEEIEEYLYLSKQFNEYLQMKKIFKSETQNNNYYYIMNKIETVSRIQISFQYLNELNTLKQQIQRRYVQEIQPFFSIFKSSPKYQVIKEILDYNKNINKVIDHYQENFKKVEQYQTMYHTFSTLLQSIDQQKDYFKQSFIKLKDENLNKVYHKFIECHQQLLNYFESLTLKMRETNQDKKQPRIRK